VITTLLIAALLGPGSAPASVTDRYLKKSGGTMTGNLSFGTDPADSGSVRLESGVSNGVCTEASPAGVDVCCGINASEEFACTGGTIESASISDPTRMYVATVSITATEIVGTAAGDIGHANGIQLVANPGASKMILFHGAMINYARVTASYTAGGNVSVQYLWNATTPLQASGVATSAQTFADADTGNINLFVPTFLNISDNNSAPYNASLVLKSDAGFTQPGTAAGTATLYVWYSIVTM